MQDKTMDFSYSVLLKQTARVYPQRDRDRDTGCHRCDLRAPPLRLGVIPRLLDRGLTHLARSKCLAVRVRSARWKTQIGSGKVGAARMPPTQTSLRNRTKQLDASQRGVLQMGSVQKPRQCHVELSKAGREYAREAPAHLGLEAAHQPYPTLSPLGALRRTLRNCVRRRLNIYLPANSTNLDPCFRCFFTKVSITLLGGNRGHTLAPPSALRHVLQMGRDPRRELLRRELRERLARGAEVAEALLRCCLPPDTRKIQKSDDSCRDDTESENCSQNDN